MTKKPLNMKYPGKLRPAVGYSNGEMSVDLTFSSVVQQAISVNDLPEIMYETVKQMSKIYSQIQWIIKKMTMINGKSFIEFEFISHKTIKDVYSLIYITVIDENLFISAFNCTLEQQSKWESLAKESMNSIKEIKTRIRLSPRSE